MEHVMLPPCVEAAMNQVWRTCHQLLMPRHQEDRGETHHQSPGFMLCGKVSQAHFCSSLMSLQSAHTVPFSTGPCYAGTKQN